MSLSPERREDFMQRLAAKYAERTGLSVEECRALAEEVNRGGPHPHRDALIATGFAVLGERLARVRSGIEVGDG